MTDRTDNEITALVEAATPPPWGIEWVEGAPYPNQVAAYHPFVRVADIHQGDADAQFIAAARSLVPSLLARAQKAEAAAAIYRDERDAEARANKTLAARLQAVEAERGEVWRGAETVRQLEDSRLKIAELQDEITLHKAAKAVLRGALNAVKSLCGEAEADPGAVVVTHEEFLAGQLVAAPTLAVAVSELRAALDVPLDTPEGETARPAPDTSWIRMDILEEKRPRRYDQCDDTCTVDCGHCKGAGRPEGETAKADEPLNALHPTFCMRDCGCIKPRGHDGDCDLTGPLPKEGCGCLACQTACSECGGQVADRSCVCLAPEDGGQ